jgi:hypothetical protein
VFVHSLSLDLHCLCYILQRFYWSRCFFTHSRFMLFPAAPLLTFARAPLLSVTSCSAIAHSRSWVMFAAPLLTLAYALLLPAALLLEEKELRQVGRQLNPISSPAGLSPNTKSNDKYVCMYVIQHGSFCSLQSFSFIYHRISSCPSHSIAYLHVPRIPSHIFLLLA